MKYLLDPKDYPLPNPRIDGFKKLRETGAQTVDIFAFSLDAFDYFLKNKKLPEEFVRDLTDAAREIIASAATRQAVVRRAFVVPGLENPPGPYFLGLTSPEAVVNAVNDLFAFAISQKYHEPKGSQISGFVYPFIDPPKFNKESPDISMLPYGGYAVSENGGVEIFAVFGNNEGVQSLVADRYIVEARRNRYYITRRAVPQKNKMICTTKDSQRDLVDVPIEVQFDQALSDNEILEVGRVVSELSQKYGPQRVEFSSDGTSLIFNEVADYWRETQQIMESFTANGTVIVVKEIGDLKKLEEIPTDKLESGSKIIYIDPAIVAERQYDVLGAVSAWGNKLVVLYPGLAATQHAMRVLADKGHRAFLVGSQQYEEGDEVKITAGNGKVRVTNITRIDDESIVSLWDASILGIELCGGKANRLSLLKAAGHQVPHGSVITTLLFDHVLAMLNIPIPPPLPAFDGAYQQLANPSDNIRKLVMPIAERFQGTPNKVFAVRSSATIEDSASHSMAGMFDTFLGVTPTQLPAKVLEVIRSAFSGSVYGYIVKNPDLKGKLKMAVVIQEMIPARAAGVIFGADIRARDPNVVEIEAAAGLGEAIVSGSAQEVERVKFSRLDRKVLSRSGKEILSPSEQKALFMLSERLREEFGDVPQDIEWAIDQGGQIWVLQTRDLIY